MTFEAHVAKGRRGIKTSTSSQLPTPVAQPPPHKIDVRQGPPSDTLPATSSVQEWRFVLSRAPFVDLRSPLSKTEPDVQRGEKRHNTDQQPRPAGNPEPSPATTGQPAPRFGGLAPKPLTSPLSVPEARPSPFAKLPGGSGPLDDLAAPPSPAVKATFGRDKPPSCGSCKADPPKQASAGPAPKPRHSPFSVPDAPTSPFGYPLKMEPDVQRSERRQSTAQEPRSAAATGQPAQHFRGLFSPPSPNLPGGSGPLDHPASPPSPAVKATFGRDKPPTAASCKTDPPKQAATCPAPKPRHSPFSFTDVPPSPLAELPDGLDKPSVKATFAGDTSSPFAPPQHANTTPSGFKPTFSFTSISQERPSFPPMQNENDNISTRVESLQRALDSERAQRKNDQIALDWERAQRKNDQTALDSERAQHKTDQATIERLSHDIIEKGDLLRKRDADARVHWELYSKELREAGRLRDELGKTQEQLRARKVIAEPAVCVVLREILGTARECAREQHEKEVQAEQLASLSTSNAALAAERTALLEERGTLVVTVARLNVELAAQKETSGTQTKELDLLCADLDARTVDLDTAREQLADNAALIAAAERVLARLPSTRPSRIASAFKNVRECGFVVSPSALFRTPSVLSDRLGKPLVVAQSRIFGLAKVSRVAVAEFNPAVIGALAVRWRITTLCVALILLIVVVAMASMRVYQ